MKLDGFKSCITAGWLSPGAGSYLALTVSADVRTSYPEVDVPEIAAWFVTAEGVEPVDLEVQVADQGIRQLAGYWPVADLAAASVLVVGAGSIGGAAAHALATYGVGRLILLDPDRLLGRNLVVGHLAHPTSVLPGTPCTALRHARPARVPRSDLDAATHAHSKPIDGFKHQPARC